MKSAIASQQQSQNTRKITQATAEREGLRFEINKLAGMADDAALPEPICERAAKLLKVAAGG